MDLARGVPTCAYVDYVLRRIKMFLDHQVTPYMVFDGDYLPSKAETEKSRSASRENAKRKGMELLQEGNNQAAFDYLQKSVDITPTMAAQVIHELKKLGLPYVVAPYEADAQMVYLESRGIVQAIVSEDSDLLIFGASKLLTKLNDRAELVEIDKARFRLCREISLIDFTPEQLRTMAIISGCDYSDGIPKIGIKLANRFVRKYKTAEKVLRGIRLDGSYTVPTDFEVVLTRADLTFQYQRVYCVQQKKLTMLNEPQSPISVPEFEHFIGGDLPIETCQQIALGKIDPITKTEITIDLNAQPGVQVTKPKPTKVWFKPIANTPLSQKPTNTPPPSNITPKSSTIVKNRYRRFFNRAEDSESEIDDEEATTTPTASKFFSSAKRQKTFENKENKNPSSSDIEEEEPQSPVKRKSRFDSSDSDTSPPAKKTQSFPITPVTVQRARTTSSTPTFLPGFMERYSYRPNTPR
jgi:5'-3' exonuclease